MAYGYLKSEAGLAKWIQSALRSVWSKHPAKLSLLQKKRVRLKNGPNNKMIFHIQCEHCRKLFKLKDVEVNHKKQVGGLSDLAKLPDFVRNLLVVDESELEILCKECHGIITYMERYGVSRRDAVIEKKVIAFSKLSEKEQLEKCKLAKFSDIPKTKIGRKNAVRNYLKDVMPK